MTRTIPSAETGAIKIRAGARAIQLSNPGKIFFPERGITKRRLIEYYASIAAAVLPHLHDRAMVMKRYPNGIAGKFFFMKRTQEHRPDWIETCPILHASGSLIHFPMTQDAASLLWLVNLGCIDLNPWYATRDDTDRPDSMHFDMDPVAPAKFAQVSGAAKTSGSRGIHVYVPIRRGPTQKQVWTVAKRNAAVSTPVTWEELEAGAETGDFTLFNVPRRIEEKGDLFAPVISKRGRCDLERFL